MPEKGVKLWRAEVEFADGGKKTIDYFKLEASPSVIGFHTRAENGNEGFVLIPVAKIALINCYVVMMLAVSADPSAN